MVPDAEFARINVEGTRRVLKAVQDAGVRRLVFTSTTALYGHASRSPDGAVWVDEDTVPQPRNIYHRTKLEAEALLREAARADGLQVRIIRMSRCFPEPAPVMAAYRLHRGVDARDVASAHALALTNAGAPLQTYIISGRTPFIAADGPALLRDAPAVPTPARPTWFAPSLRAVGPCRAPLTVCIARTAPSVSWAGRRVSASRKFWRNSTAKAPRSFRPEGDAATLDLTPRELWGKTLVVLARGAHHAYDSLAAAVLTRLAGLAHACMLQCSKVGVSRDAGFV